MGIFLLRSMLRNKKIWKNTFVRSPVLVKGVY